MSDTPKQSFTGSADTLALDPCPFCGSAILHVTSLARSFDPPRLFHEWHHCDDNEDACPIRRNGKIVASTNDSLESQAAVVQRWNARSFHPAQARPTPASQEIKALEKELAKARDDLEDAQIELRNLRNCGKAPQPVNPAYTWQDISTAPMDGTEIIGVFHRRYDEDGPATVYGPWTLAWDGRKWRSSWDGSEVISSESDFGTEYKGPDIEPTHWQPLPGVSIPSTSLCSGCLQPDVCKARGGCQGPAIPSTHRETSK